MGVAGPEEALQRLELVIGRVRAAEDHPGARAPSYLLTIDLGGHGTREASIPAGQYDRAALVGRQVVCAIEGDAVLVLGAHSHEYGVVLLRPDRDVEDGSPVA
jgi:tRNA-binding protein